MASRGAGQGYAKGKWALGECARSGRKMLLKHMIADGYYPNLIVDPEWYEGKHPQESLPAIKDPVALYRPAPERDRIGSRVIIAGAGVNDLALGYEIGSPSVDVQPAPPVVDPIGTLLMWLDDVAFERAVRTTDGIAITAASRNADYVASSIGLFVAINSNNPNTGSTQVNFTSTDGISWTDQSATGPWGAAKNNLFYFEASGLFVTFQISSNTYYTSPDGITWTSRTFATGATNHNEQSAYGTDKVLDYMVFGFGSIYSTTDGINWTFIDGVAGNGHFIYAPSNLGDKYWVFGNSGANFEVYSSLDGTFGSYSRDTAAETSLNAAGLSTPNSLWSVAHSNTIGKFVINMNNTSGGTPSDKLAYSSDGVTWTNPGAVKAGYAVRYSATLGVFVRTSGNFVSGDLLLSTDGIVWTVNNYAGFAAPARFPSADLLTSF